MRLLILIICTLMIAGMGYFTLQIWGKSQTHVPFDHPLLNQKPPLFLVQVETPEQAESIKAKDRVVFVLPLKVSSDGQVFVASESTWEKLQQSEKYKNISNNSSLPKTKFQYFTAQELLDMGPGIHKFEGFLQSYPQRDFVLSVTDNVEGIQNKIMDVVKVQLPKGSIAIASPIEPVIKSIKEIRPLTAFSLSQGEQVRLLSFESIGLVSTMQVNGDFIFSALSWKNRPLLSKGLADEMHRRFKKVFLGPLSSEAEIEQAQGLGADGFIFSSVEDYEKLHSFVRF